MQVKLVVTKEDETSRPNILTFSQEVITIGRDKTCDLWLDDPRKIIGRVHARVECTSRQVQLVDLGSKNFTVFKGKRIEAEKPQILEKGDDFRIGDRIVIFEGLIEDQPAPEPIDVTVIDQKFPNPFMDEVQDLAQALKKLAEKYELAVSNRREDELRTALAAGLNDLKPHPTTSVIASLINPTPKSGSIPDEIPIASGSSSISDRIRHLCDFLLNYFSKYIKAPWNFRWEFMGQTIITSTKKFTIHTGSLQEIREFLLSGNLSTDDFKNRMTELDREAHGVLIHQLALLEGYKVSVEDGTRNILEFFNPEILKKKLDQECIKLGRLKIPYRYLPLFYHWKLLQLYQQNYFLLVRDDRSSIEKKMFRPGFVRGYEERFSASNKGESSG